MKRRKRKTNKRRNRMRVNRNRIIKWRTRKMKKEEEGCQMRRRGRRILKGRRILRIEEREEIESETTTQT